MLDSCNARFSSSNFLQNTGGIGGALRYIGLLPSFLSTLTEASLYASKDSSGYWVLVGGNRFKDNRAIIIGNEIGGVFAKISLSVSSEDFQFTQLKVDSPYAKVDTYTDYQYLLSNFRSGAKSFTYRIQLYDLLNQKIIQDISTSKRDNQAPVSPSPPLGASAAGFTLSTAAKTEVSAIRCKLLETNDSSKLEEQSISIDGSNIVDYSSNKEESFFGFSFDSIQITGIPEQSASFCMSFEGLQRLNVTSNLFSKPECVDVQVRFRKCVVGEIYTKRCSNCIMNTCNVCSLGSYSLVDPLIDAQQSCLTCNT